ncbi:hypothetical protein B0H14DRAFT_3688939 [Mycena olivaceomarginata]|nr:hypothetical protein B0H14DRAFT_3688939 [Mycena olivaceomarginata]
MNARPELAPPRALDSTAVRLPSYKELTAACGEAPQAHKTSRSSLFTAGLIHLPPLQSRASRFSPFPFLIGPSPGSGSGLYKIPPRPMKRRYYDDADADDTPDAHRYLDLSQHCPLPPHGHENDHRPPRRLATVNRLRRICISIGLVDVPVIPSVASRIRTTRTPARSFDAHNNNYDSGVAGNYDSPTYDPTPTGQPRLKFSHAKAGGRTKKQALSCYFCRERKIACGRPDEGSGDGTCNQCARRKIDCRYPTVSHRGQHSRIKSAARKGIAESTPGSGEGSVSPRMQGGGAAWRCEGWDVAWRCSWTWNVSRGWSGGCRCASALPNLQHDYGGILLTPLSTSTDHVTPHISPPDHIIQPILTCCLIFQRATWARTPSIPNSNPSQTTFKCRASTSRCVLVETAFVRRLPVCDLCTEKGWGHSVFLLRSSKMSDGVLVDVSSVGPRRRTCDDAGKDGEQEVGADGVRRDERR